GPDGSLHWKCGARLESRCAEGEKRAMSSKMILVAGLGMLIAMPQTIAGVGAMQDPDKPKQEEPKKEPPPKQEKPKEKPPKPPKPSDQPKPEKPKGEPDKPAKPPDRPAKQDERAKQDEKQRQKQAEDARKSQDKAQKQEQKEQRDARQPSSDRSSARATAQARPSGKGRKIEEVKFRQHFGREHHFHVGHIDSGRRFVYSGYSFELVEVWPAGWGYNDDCYIEEDGDDYYLIDLVHPGARVLVI